MKTITIIAALLGTTGVSAAALSAAAGFVAAYMVDEALSFASRPGRTAARTRQSCWKRDVLVQDHANDKRWCHEAGNACAVAKRAATAVLAAVEKRQNGCPYPGQSCWKRDEAGLLEVRQNGCQYRGQSCWKRDVVSGKHVLARDVPIAARCNGPAGECTKAARDLQAVEIAAREVLASLE
ncbi:clock-controlled pheromone ccg-4 [Magnaporthiopsis poae ATCC 64411]|uniref:Clock-controlled pheromone ccg-4 n=1 Tax=Magnaporthiopsis poae (strain ATCC 64411 / 73-15) TaxID=644358 RepID=A0A0C4DTV0_MAGP6|nr:clock-controlled pheromone ccg-4 [Magnaporthiopsis poae ATCC 64411]